MARFLVYPLPLLVSRNLKKKHGFYFKRPFRLDSFKKKQPTVILGSLFFSPSPSFFLAQKVFTFLLGFFMVGGQLIKHLGSLSLVFALLGGETTKLHTLNAQPLTFFYNPSVLFGLFFFGFLGLPSLVNQPGLPLPCRRKLGDLFAVFSQEISLTYRISFVGLSRRLRKIVKNKYRFRRQYVCVLPSSRLRYGFHLVRFCLRFIGGKTRVQRLTTLFQSIISAEEASPVLFIRYQQQKHVLGVLRRQHLLA